tara:strand:- start:1984 stop:2295 length:312 start_codon:yes stop_codon:yes gene_type:complete
MKLPSFIRLPKSKKFNFDPRHYDPIKDDIEHRVSEINNNVKLKNKRYFDHKKKSEVVSGSKLQLIIALLLFFFLFGWLYIGNKIFIFTSLIPLWYIFKKIRKS